MNLYVYFKTDKCELLTVLAKQKSYGDIIKTFLASFKVVKI